MPKRMRIFVPWLLGFLAVANVYLVPSSGASPRATDALGVVLGLWLLWRFATRGVRIVPFVTLFALSVIPLLWGLYTFFAGDKVFTGDENTTVLSVRWLLAVPWGYTLFVLARNPQHRIGLIWGLWWGCVANTVVLLLQFYELVEFTQSIGLASQRSQLTAIWSLGGIPRAPGMHAHPNASTAVVSLIVPLSLYLYYTRKARIWTVVASLGVLLAGTQFSQTRSALLVSLATVLAVSITNRDLRPTLRLVALLMLGGLPGLFWIGPPGGWERWLDPSGWAPNYRERFFSAAEALWLSLQHPLGIGREALQVALERSGLGAAHNAFVQIALIYGLLLAVALASLMFILALQTFRGSRTPLRLEAVLAFHLFGLFLWEEHFNNTSLVILTGWLTAASMVLISSNLKQRSRARKIPARQPLSNRLRADRVQFAKPISR